MLSDSNFMATNVTCHICSEGKLSLLPSYHRLPRVASDCVPWRAGGKLATCESCSCVQNPVDAAWYNETNEIYQQYKIYCQS